MDDTDKTAGESERAVAGAAKMDVSAVGKAASLADGAKTANKKPLKENAYRAEYLGSGTFTISKPKRSKSKRRQSALKNPQRGARK